MLNHLRVLFSSQATKAWIAGLVVFIAPYVVQWLNSMTAESVVSFFGRYGLQLSEGGAAAIVAIIGVLSVYMAKNNDKAA